MSAYNHESDTTAETIKEIAHAITPLDAAPGHDEMGGVISSLTESVMGVTAALVMIANAIDNLAEATMADKEPKIDNESLSE